MAGSKRERELHRQKLARQQREAARAAQVRSKRLRIAAIAVAIITVIGIVGGVALATSSSDDSPAAAPTTPAGDGVVCAAPNDEEPNNKQSDGVKDTVLMKNAEYAQYLTTNCGEIRFTMDQTKAPETTRTMAYLSNLVKFYDNTICHRLTTAGIYVLQCGDPSGNGTGGPGFAIDEENLPKAGADGSALYARGTVAMANAGTGTTGSQFFVVLQDSPLPPNYTVLGEVTEGMEIFDYVAAQGTADGSPDGPPQQPLQIQTMESRATYEVEQ